MSRHWFRAVALAALWAGAPAATAANYMIAFNNGGAFLPEVNSSTGFRRDTSFALAPSSGTGALTGSAYAGPGYLSPFARIDCTWDSGFSGAFSGKTRASMSTGDLIITGPAGPSSVSGTLNLRVRFLLDKTGGFANNNGHAAAFSLNASTLYSGTSGTLTYGNFNLSGSGCFSAVASPSVDMIVPLTGNYPVNASFSINIYTEAALAAYGNAAVNPGMVAAEGGDVPDAPGGRGIHLEVGGPVMTLPAGYTLNSASWGVVNNVYTPPAGVEEAGPSDLALVLTGANPTSGLSRLSLRLARDARARVVVHDIAGRAIRTLLDEWLPAGVHAVTWDGRGPGGCAAPAGLYFVRAGIGDASLVRTLVRMR